MLRAFYKTSRLMVLASCILMSMVTPMASALTISDAKLRAEADPTLDNNLAYLWLLYQDKQIEEAFVGAMALYKTERSERVAIFLYNVAITSKQYTRLREYFQEESATYTDDRMRSLIVKLLHYERKLDEAATYAEEQFAEHGGRCLQVQLLVTKYRARKYAEVIATGKPLFATMPADPDASFLAHTIMLAAKAIADWGSVVEVGKPAVLQFTSWAPKLLSPTIDACAKMKDAATAKELVEACVDKYPTEVLTLIGSYPIAFSEAAVVSAIATYDFADDTAIPIAAFNAYPWATSTPEDVVAYCNQLLLVTPVTAESAAFVAIVRDKKMALQ